MPALAVEALRRHKAQWQPDEALPIVCGPGGVPPRTSQVRLAWLALLAAGVKPRTLHVGRHTCASALVAANVPLTVVAEYLGDSVRTVTSTYLHFLPPREAAQG